MLGIAVMWSIGRAFEQRLAALDPQRKLLWVSVEQIHRTQAALRRRSTSLLLLNRFLPGFRAVVFFAAGASNVPLFKSVALGGLSATMLNGLLLFAGVTIGHNEEALAAFFKRFQTLSFLLLAVVLLAFLARWLWRRRAG
jgi:membrane protein DedA with SNARE-associated domain